jgi:hypothetical protein
MSRKLYVLVRADLPRTQKAVQAAHAVGRFCSNEFRKFHWNGREMETIQPRWDDETLVLLRVENLNELLEWYKLCEKDATAFHEPDIGNEMTAFATPIEHDLFHVLKLL